MKIIKFIRSVFKDLSVKDLSLLIINDMTISES